MEGLFLFKLIVVGTMLSAVVLSVYFLVKSVEK